MCIICAQFNAGKLTSKEALQNLGELMNSNPVTVKGRHEQEHYTKVVDRIMEKELGKSEDDPEMNKLWQKETKATR